MALPKLPGTSRTISYSPAPSPCVLPSDGAGRLRRSGWWLWPIGSLGLSLLTGCAPHAPSALNSRATPPQSQLATQTSATISAPAWNAVFQKWWRAATTPQTSVAKLPVRPVVSINIAVIAAHHPAWKLADALEHSQAGAATLAALPAPTTVVALTPQAPPVPFGPLLVGAPEGVPGFYQAEKTVIVRDLDQLQTVVYERQTGALHDFMRDAAAAQAQSRAAQAKTLQAALAEDVEVARRLDLAALTPMLPSDPIQLEMTNLRLDLLQNLYATPQARKQARQRLSALEAQWEVKLRSQENQRLTELARLRQERPQRLRQAGETRIAATLSAAAQQDTETREAILNAHNSLLAQDFTPATARLGLVLPAAALPAQQLAGLAASPPQRHSALPQKVSETFRVKTASRIASIKSGPGTAANGFSQGEGKITQVATIQALRAQAWHDARRWASIAAQRAGWDWHDAESQRPTTAPDRTAEALRLLNLS